MKSWFKRYPASSGVMSVVEIQRAMAAPTTSREAFFLLYSRLLELRCGLKDLEFSEEACLSFEGANGYTYKLHLENLWILCSGDRASADETIEKYVSVVANLGKETPIEEGSIVAWIRDQAFLDTLGAKPDLAMRHLAADLWIVYAARQEGGSRSISSSELARLGLSVEALFPLALKNLGSLLLPPEQTDFNNFTLLTAGGDFTPALLLLDELWEEIADQFPGDIVVVAPTSDSVLVTSSQSPAGISHIRKRAIELEATEDHVVSTTLLRRVNGGWKSFD